MPYSTCCGAFTNMEEYGICPDCLEHCDFEDQENMDEPDDHQIYNNFNHEGGIKITKDEWQGR